MAALSMNVSLEDSPVVEPRTVSILFWLMVNHGLPTETGLKPILRRYSKRAPAHVVHQCRRVVVAALAERR